MVQPPDQDLAEADDQKPPGMRLSGAGCRGQLEVPGGQGVCLLDPAAERAIAFAASSSRLFGDAFVSSDRSRRIETAATSSTAARNAASFAFDGLVKPLIFRTNCSDAARTSSSVTGGSKLNNGRMFRHIPVL